MPDGSTFGPFTIWEVLGALLTCLLVIATYRRSGPEVRHQRAALLAASCVVLILLLSMRFQLLPAIVDDSEIQKLASSSKEAQEVAEVLSRAPTVTKQPLMNYILQMRLDGVSQYFGSLSQGKLIVDGSFVPEFSIQMIEHAKSTIQATSYAQATNWWDQPWGHTYEQENERAVTRGVTVSRTFLFTNQDDLRTNQPLMIEEYTACINVKYANIGDVHSNHC